MLADKRKPPATPLEEGCSICSDWRPEIEGPLLSGECSPQRPGRSPGLRGSVAGPFPSTSGGRQWASALDAARAVRTGPNGRNARTSPAYSGATAADFHRLPYSPGTGTWTCKATESLAPGRRGSKAGQIERGHVQSVRLVADPVHLPAQSVQSASCTCRLHVGWLP